MLESQFDPNGNLSGGMGFTLTWDAEDRVKAISYNGTQKRIEYDHDGVDAACGFVRWRGQ